MGDSWIVSNLNAALTTWNDKLGEIWQLLTQSPQTFKDGQVWAVMVGIHGALQAIGYGLLVLFFAAGVVKTCGTFVEAKRPEQALKLFIRFALAKAAVTYGLDLMLAVFQIVQGMVSTVINQSGVSGMSAVIILLICLIALVAGSAYGIFFAAESPDENAISVQEAVELLTEEYRDRLEEIENNAEYDRQEIESNDGSYAIAWQDVLAVFASQTAGDANGTTVAYLDEDNVDRLRTVLWDMNELDWRTESQLQEVEQTNEEGEIETTTITETVLIIELTHHTLEEMRETYHFTDRQNEYLTLLSGEETTTLWGELLGGFIQGNGELMAPGMDTVFADGALQWPLPVAGTITSPQGYRTDPITGETSYHSGTDIAVPEDTPILAAADGAVTIANATDSWGGSYGYYVKIDHGGGLTTLYAHCSKICVTVGQEVKAGQVIAYVGHTGRATGAHLHFEVRK